MRPSKGGMLGNGEESSRNHNLQADGSPADYYLQCHGPGKPGSSGKMESGVMEYFKGCLARPLMGGDI